jgi:hypothetical protein
VTDFANLVLAADSRQVVQATKDVDKLADAGGRAEGGANRLTTAFAGFAAKAAAAGIAAAGLVATMTFRGAVREAEALETRMARLNAIITATGGVAGRTAEQLLESARALNRQTLLDTDGIMQAQQTLLTFRNVQGDVFDRAIVAAADMSAALGGDLNSATMQLAKALENPTEGLSALSRSGTVFTQAQKDMVAAMVEAGRTAEAQAFILSELEAQYGGAARTGSALAFAQDSLAQTWQESLIRVNDLLGLTDMAASAYQALERVVISATAAFEGIVAAKDTLITATKVLAVAVIGLAATQLPAAILALASYGASMSIATIATGVFTAAVNVARAATIALGGPIGILWGLIGAAGAAWLVFRDGADVATPAALAAKDASDQLNAALGVFYATAAPNAAAQAVALAQANVDLANAAYAAAEAEVAKRRAILESATALYSEAIDPEGALIIGAQQDDAVRRYSSALDELNRASERIVESQTRQRNAITAVTGAMSEGMTEANTAARELATTANITVEGLEGIGGAGGRAAAGIDDATDAAKDFADQADGPLKSAVDGVSRAFADFVVRGFRDFKGFVRSVLSSFKSMLAEMIATAARNRIMIGLGIGGVAGVAQAATGALGGGGGILGAIGGIGSALVGGFTNTLGAFFSGGLGAGFGSIGAQIGAGLTGSLTGIAGAIGAIAAPLLAVGAVFSFFRKRTKELDSGIRVTVDGFDALIETFRTTETSRFWGLSKKVRTTFDEAAEEVATPLRGAIDAVQGSVVEIADLLGASSGIFDGFTHDFTVSLKGLDEAARNAALEAEFASLGEAMLALVPDLDRLGAANMTYADTIRQVQAVLSQRYDLETRILQLQGDTAALRAREMERTVEFNRDLLQTIYDLEDGAAAMQAAATAAADALARIQPDDFATAFDFQRAAALARQGLGATQAGPMVYAAPAVAGAPVSQAEAGSVAELRALNARLANMETELRQYHLADLRHGKKTADTLEKWDVIGLPGEQA